MKKYVAVLLMVFALFSSACAEEAFEHTKIIDEYTKIYGGEISRGLSSDAKDNIRTVMPEFSVDQLLKEATRGNSIFSAGEILSRLLELLLGEIRRTIKLLVFIPAIAMLNTYISGMDSGFNSKGAISAAFFVSYAVMAGIAATAFIETVRCGQGAIQNIAVFMRGLVPVALASLAAGGAVISATTFEIALMSVIEITELAVEKLFLPLVMMSAALNIANNISKNLNAGKLVQLINRTVKWGIGIMMTVFVGITGLQGIASGSADGLTVKVTKFAASNLIPMVGGILAETVETVMNCGVVIKNAVGVIGIVTVIVLAALPIVKVAACLIIFRICAAVIQPVSDDRCGSCVSELGDSVSAVLGMITAVVVMFVIILTIIINIGNSAVLLGR